MKKKFVFLLFVLILFPAAAKSDGWDDFSNVDRMWDGQKSITNQQFEQVMEKLEEKGKQQEEKIKKKKQKKLFGSGTTLHTELNPDNDVPEIQSPDTKDEGVLINIPVNLILNGSVLEKGFYKVYPERDYDTKKAYITLYQSQFFKGKIEVTETEDDFDEENINFAKIIPYNDSFVKIIFGSIDYNAYAIIPYVD